MIVRSSEATAALHMEEWMRPGICILTLVCSLSLAARAWAQDAKPDLPLADIAKADLPSVKPDGVKKSDGVKSDGGKKPDGPSNPCGGITGRGCCEGDKLKYCAGNQVKIKDCTTTPLKVEAGPGFAVCGWDPAKNYYTCGTSNSADPSGFYLRDCASIPIPDVGIKSDAKKDTGGAKADQAQPAGDVKVKTDDGCGCEVAGGASAAPWALILFLFLRRRR
jgi:MYXO-CTERM domain-containing protein